MKRNHFAGAALVAVAALSAAVWWWADAGGSRSARADLALRPDDAKVTAIGAMIYRQRCASCHGAALQGQTGWRVRGPDGLLPAPPHDVSGHTWHHSDELLVRITRDGVAAAAGEPGYRTAMPLYRGTLSDGEIVAVLSWVKSQWPAPLRARHDQINASARARQP